MVEFTVTNPGDVSGKDVAQLYVGNCVSQVEKPCKELRDFVKLSLQAGESKRVRRVLGQRAFSWYNPAEKMWEADNGRYEILVGSSVADIRLHQAFDYCFGVSPLRKITPETYVADILNQSALQTQRALDQTGLRQALQALLQGDNSQIFANIPLRSLNMAGIDPQLVNKFIELANA